METDWVRYYQVVMQVLLDTSFIMYLAERQVKNREHFEDCFGPIRPLVIPEVLEELRQLSLRGYKKARQARRALEYAQQLPCLKHGRRGAVDDILRELALDKDIMVATLDRVLRRKLREKEVGMLSLSGGELIVER